MNIAVLGSTGSVGRQALDVARERGFSVCALAASTNVDLLEAQAREFTPAMVALYDEACAKQLKARLGDTPVKVLSGSDGVCQCAQAQQADVVLNAVVGIAGLAPSVAALKAKKRLALANKESLVTAGHLIMPMAEKDQIIPVDSEHSAIFQCLQSGRQSEVESLILTASGGPFFGKKASQLRSVTPQQALKHPSWKMGRRITVDSATLMNKGFEMIEAAHLFSVLPENIQVVVHKESIVHSMVCFCDGSVIAQMSVPDMRLPVQYAICYPERAPSFRARLDFASLSGLTFAPPDRKTFKALDLCSAAYSWGGNAGAVLNSADEAAVALFLSGKIAFLDICDLCAMALRTLSHIEQPNMEDIYQSDAQAREFVTNEVLRR